ncbi:MAG: undecaprenyldiphospho-muramoylpentapeptide beta-N-acetylglucosaminyltransferase, partial [Nitrospirae bacterium]|nr:undecaprenyldiphospho-muramoylpentapeptide beta-N-acetylglucosaminyltransferase [Nitrospirota bacterium]
MRVIIAGGGTGGHLYPGIAVAEEIYRQEPESDVLFVGTKTGIESRILPKEGYRLETIPAGGVINKNMISKFTSLMKIAGGFIKSFFVLRRFKPDVVVGVGGYASAPMLSAASIMRYPTMIMEQNLYPGTTNRFLSRIVDRVVVAFDGSDKFFNRKVDVLGNPVRRGISDCKYNAGRTFTVFIFGGSQGSHAINKGIVESLEYLQEKAGQIRFLHQTGEKDFAWVDESYKKAGIDAEVAPYVYNIVDMYGKSDIVICRAGATTIAEISASGRPSILIPYPHAAHDHQRSNAEYMQTMGSAEVILEKDLSGKILADKIKYFMYNKD